MMAGFASQIRACKHDAPPTIPRRSHVIGGVLASICFALPTQAQQADATDCTAQASYLAVLATSMSLVEDQILWEDRVMRFSGGSFGVMSEAERLNIERAQHHAALDASMGRRGGYDHLHQHFQVSCGHFGGLE